VRDEAAVSLTSWLGWLGSMAIVVVGATCVGVWFLPLARSDQRWLRWLGRLVLVGVGVAAAGLLLASLVHLVFRTWGTCLPPGVEIAGVGCELPPL
jgi:hypothetical protein